MPPRIEYTRSEQLPKLGWFACLDTGRDRLSVVHGRGVECRDEWMIEGVWDGPFGEGNFHRHEHVFGSGIRLDGNAIHFLPSCALVDRLLCCRDADKLLVSNSLLILLAMTGARLDERHDYRVETRAILAGIGRYASRFHIVHPSIDCFHQVYHKAIVVEDGTLSFQSRIFSYDFESFDQYRSMIQERLAAIRANYADPARDVPLSAFGTLTTGYDSTAVACLVRDLGVEQYFTFAGAWSRQRPEFDTRQIAEALKVGTISLDSYRSETSENELYLHASNPLGHQLPLLSMATHIERRCPGAVVFTGYHGGMVWNVDLADQYATEEIRRHDISGLDLSELRLKSGFINIAVPFLFAPNVKSIRAVSRLPEMTPWRLHNGYDRPISRRIVEQAGVARHLFGMKKGGLLGGGMRPVDRRLRRRYFDYLGRTLGISRPFIYFRLACDKLVWHGVRYTARSLPGRPPFAAVKRKLMQRFWRFREGESLFSRRINFRSRLFLWSVEELTGQLAAARALRPDLE